MEGEQMKTAEPAVIGAAVAALINALVLLLLKQELSIEERTAIVTVVTALWALWTRSRVTPVA
jgi:hypothetical protein